MTKTMNEDFSTAQVSVGSTATKIYTGQSGVDEVTIANLGTTDVFIGKSGVTTSTGFLLPGTKGASLTLCSTVDIYGIVASGSQAVSVLVTF
jgi:hypothetical protein